MLNMVLFAVIATILIVASRLTKNIDNGSIALLAILAVGIYFVLGIYAFYASSMIFAFAIVLRMVAKTLSKQQFTSLVKSPAISTNEIFSSLGILFPVLVILLFTKNFYKTIDFDFNVFKCGFFAPLAVAFAIYASAIANCFSKTAISVLNGKKVAVGELGSITLTGAGFAFVGVLLSSACCYFSTNNLPFTLITLLVSTCGYILSIVVSYYFTQFKLKDKNSALKQPNSSPNSKPDEEAKQAEKGFETPENAQSTIAVLTSEEKEEVRLQTNFVSVLFACIISVVFAIII